MLAHTARVARLQCLVTAGQTVARRGSRHAVFRDLTLAPLTGEGDRAWLSSRQYRNFPRKAPGSRHFDQLQLIRTQKPRRAVELLSPGAERQARDAGDDDAGQSAGRPRQLNIEALVA